jgi:3-deoxy-D-manno-octulosonate 8-phosphate phosphatase (KDO 8-P phosphatase)
MNVLSLFKDIKLFVLDVDGVLTDGSLIVMENAEMVRTMNVRDGYAMQLAIKKGYDIVIISGGTSTAVYQRLEKLGIKNIFLSVKDKLTLLQTYLVENNYTKEQVLYLGDDMPDVPPMAIVGLSCAPVDAVQEVVNISQYISPVKGGYGCVRDVIEKVLKLNNDWNDTDHTTST